MWTGLNSLFQYKLIYVVIDRCALSILPRNISLISEAHQTTDTFRSGSLRCVQMSRSQTLICQAIREEIETWHKVFSCSNCPVQSIRVGGQKSWYGGAVTREAALGALRSHRDDRQLHKHVWTYATAYERAPQKQKPSNEKMKDSSTDTRVWLLMHESW